MQSPLLSVKIGEGASPIFTEGRGVYTQVNENGKYPGQVFDPFGPWVIIDFSSWDLK